MYRIPVEIFGIGGTNLIKGCNKRVIVMKDTGNDMIEEAFFILRPVSGKSAISEGDLLKHANSILEKSLYNDRFSSLSMNVSKPQKKTWKFGAFCFGVIVGITVSLLFVV